MGVSRTAVARTRSGWRGWARRIGARGGNGRRPSRGRQGGHRCRRGNGRHDGRRCRRGHRRHGGHGRHDSHGRGCPRSAVRGHRDVLGHHRDHSPGRLRHRCRLPCGFHGLLAAVAALRAAAVHRSACAADPETLVEQRIRHTGSGHRVLCAASGCHGERASSMAPMIAKRAVSQPEGRWPAEQHEEQAEPDLRAHRSGSPSVGGPSGIVWRPSRAIIQPSSRHPPNVVALLAPAVAEVQSAGSIGPSR